MMFTTLTPSLPHTPDGWEGAELAALRVGEEEQ